MKLLKSLTWMLMMVLALGMLTGCSDDDDESNPTGPATTDYFNDIKDLGVSYFGAGTKNITAEGELGLYANLVSGVELFIIDYRSADHFNNLGHIDVDAVAGANATIVNWPIADLMDNLSQIPAGVKVINVCYTGQTASQATSALRILGYDAWNLKWGMCGWTSDTVVNRGIWVNKVPDQDYALENTPNTTSNDFSMPVLESDADDVTEYLVAEYDEYFSSETGPKTMSNASVYANIADANDLFIVNYWPATYYNEGHIPGAIICDSGIPEYKGLDEDFLAMLPRDQKIVIYCWTGQTSSQIVSYLNVLGYDAYSLLFGINGIESHDDNGALYKAGTWYTAPVTDYPVTPGE